MHRTHRLAAGAVISLIVLLAGCAATPPAGQEQAGSAPLEMTPEQVAQARMEPEIIKVHAQYNIFPWLQYDMTDPRPQGLAITALYLFGSKSPMGVFGDGVITVKLYRVDSQSDGREARVPVHTWTFNQQEALRYRSCRRTSLGNGYRLHLRWPAEVDLVNRQIAVVVEFTRADGKTIGSNPKFLMVPSKVNG